MKIDFFIDDYDGIHVHAFFEAGCYRHKGEGQIILHQKFDGKISAILTVFSGFQNFHDEK